ncbi:hypothetical protein ACLB1S_21540 [Escherichia coli]
MNNPNGLIWFNDRY